MERDLLDDIGEPLAAKEGANGSDQLDESLEELVRTMQQRYGYTREQALERAKEFAERFKL